METEIVPLEAMRKSRAAHHAAITERGRVEAPAVKIGVCAGAKAPACPAANRAGQRSFLLPGLPRAVSGWPNGSRVTLQLPGDGSVAIRRHHVTASDGSGGRRRTDDLPGTTLRAPLAGAAVDPSGKGMCLSSELRDGTLPPTTHAGTQPNVPPHTG